MNREEKADKNLIHSPNESIPIGEPWINEAGQVGLIFRRKDNFGKIRYEFVTLDYINCQAYKAVSRNTFSGNRP